MKGHGLHVCYLPASSSSISIKHSAAHDLARWIVMIVGTQQKAFCAGVGGNYTVRFFNFPPSTLPLLLCFLSLPST
jgi:hypothetical protein